MSGKKEGVTQHEEEVVMDTEKIPTTSTIAKKKKTSSISTEESMRFMKEYLDNPSPSGHEREGQKLWRDYIAPYVDEVRVDNYLNVVGVINPEAPYKIVIEAHADEIGWAVQTITSNGLIYVDKIGGSDVQLAPGKRVNIHTENGIIEGVFGWGATHVRDKDKKPMINNIFIDVGALSSEYVKDTLGIQIGDPITFQDNFATLNGSRYIGRGLDNRMGGWMIAQVARLLKENNKDLGYGLYIVNAVQEEVGKNGARMIAESIKPDVAIITDVTHDTSTPGVNTTTHGDYKITRGPIITQCPLIQKELFTIVEEVAKVNDIKYQKKVKGRMTGTDADVFALSNGGTPTALISLPLRYMHTTVEMCSKKDVNSTVELMYHTLLALKPDYKFNTL